MIVTACRAVSNRESQYPPHLSRNEIFTVGMSGPVSGFPGFPVRSDTSKSPETGLVGTNRSGVRARGPDM